MSSHRISVIVPIYNTEQYLPRCIDSILSQTFTDFELLLIDDGSKDDSGKICDEYAAKDARVRVFHKENGGVSSARNLGLDCAIGEWVTFVDSDDWIGNTMYQEMYEDVIHEKADIAYCDINMVFSNLERCWKAAKYDSSKVQFLNNFIASEWTSLCNILVKRRLFTENQIRNPEDFRFAEDYHVATRLMYFAKKVCYVPKPLYCYNRINESSALHNFSSDHYEKERLVNLDIIAFFIKEGVYNVYAKPLCWRLLKSVQEFVLDKRTYNRFLLTHPDSHKYIWSCPYLNLKIKIMMWSLTHNLRFVAELFLFARNIRLQLSNFK